MRIISLIATATLPFALSACASAGSSQDVAAVVQDERARQAVAKAAEEGEGAKAALAGATEATTAQDPPHRR